MNNNEYVATLPSGEERIIEFAQIDDNIMKLIKKWNFIPNRCCEMLDNKICCSFFRRTSYLGGQQAYLLALIIENDIKWQFSLIDSSYQKQNLAYEIFDCDFKNELTYIG